MNEQALKERIKYIANSENRKFNQVWRDLILERLLIRLARSSYNNQLIFKGGLLLSYYINLGRETTDMDLQTTQLDMDAFKMEKVFRQICQIKISDGFIYTFSNIDKLNMEHMNYPGYRVHLSLTFGKMKDRIQVDIAVGDMLESKQESLELYQYKGKPIFEGKVSLKVYPLETIFTDKLESIIRRGSVNSRMKDYHDLVLLCREKNVFNLLKLRKNVSTLFKNENISNLFPLRFSDNEINKLQKLWENHRSGLQDIAEHLKLPVHIKDAINETNDWLLKNKIVS